MIKYSRQREAIKNKLIGRTDHPTAETLYAELKAEMPNLSVATVYRNLNQLEQWGEINRINVEGATRFDPNTDPHSHFFCRRCGAVIDMPDEDIEIRRIAQAGFGGRIELSTSHFYGVCPKCLDKDN